MLVYYNFNCKEKLTFARLEAGKIKEKSMPLSLSKHGVFARVRKIGGPENVKKHLESMGFTAGCDVWVVSELDGSLIVNVRESRVALSRELANKIIVAT